MTTMSWTLDTERRLIGTCVGAASAPSVDSPAKRAAFRALEKVLTDPTPLSRAAVLAAYYRLQAAHARPGRG